VAVQFRHAAIPVHDDAFDERLRTAQEVVAEQGQVESDDVVGQQAAQQFLAVSGDPEYLERRERDVPEVREGEVGPLPPDELRGQGEMVVLEPDCGFAAVDLVDDGVGEAAVHHDVAFPVPGARARQRRPQMAQGPEELVGVAVIVLVDVLLAQPEAVQRVRFGLRRHAHALPVIHDLASRRRCPTRSRCRPPPA
jgi:hypothetical protein